MANDTYLDRLSAQPAIRFCPSLLLLAAFLASAPLYPPNSRLMLRFAPDASPASDFLFAMMLACFAAAFFVLILSAKNPRWEGFQTGRQRIVATVGACAYGCLQVALWVLLAAGCKSAVLFAVLGVASGLCIVPVVMHWVRLYAMDFRSVMFYGSLACAASSAMGWIATMLPDAAVVVVEAALALAGSVAPLLFGRAPAAGREEGGAACAQEAPGGEAGTGLASSLRSFLSVVWVPLLGFLICTFMMAAYSFDTGGQVAQSEYAGGIVASAVVIALCMLRLKNSLVVLVDRLVVPACVAASIVLGGFPAGTPLFIAGAMLVYVPLILLALFALSSLAAMAAAGELPLPFVFAAAFLLSCVASLLGMSVQVNVPPGENLGPFLWVMLSVYFGIVVVHLGYVSWRQACSADDLGAPADDASTTQAETLQALQRGRIQALADAHALTKREQEILRYLSLGYGSAYISKTLFISDNTARTHMRNIYRKLGIGSREELLSLVNGL